MFEKDTTVFGVGADFGCGRLVCTTATSGAELVCTTATGATGAAGTTGTGGVRVTTGAGGATFGGGFNSRSSCCAIWLTASQLAGFGRSAR